MLRRCWDLNPNTGYQNFANTLIPSPMLSMQELIQFLLLRPFISFRSPPCLCPHGGVVVNGDAVLLESWLFGWPYLLLYPCIQKGFGNASSACCPGRPGNFLSAAS